MNRALLLALAIFGLPAAAAELQGPFFPGSRGGTSGGGGGSSYILSLGAVGSVPNDNACSVDGSGVFQMQPASSTKPGVVTIGAQTFAGNKTFAGTVGASNLSGTNTGDVPSARWLLPLHPVYSGSSQTPGGAAIVQGLEIFNPGPCTAIGVAYEVGSASVGNVRGAIYGPVTTPDTMTGTALVVESADVAQGTTSTTQIIDLAPTALTPGKYYYGVIQLSSSTGTYLRVTNVGHPDGWRVTYTRAGGYGAFTNPAPSAPGTTFVTAHIKIVCQ